MIQAFLQPFALASLPFIQPFAADHCCSVCFHAEAAFSAATPCPRSAVSFHATHDRGMQGMRGMWDMRQWQCQAELNQMNMNYVFMVRGFHWEFFL
jgi:hypothetical protein